MAASSSMEPMLAAANENSWDWAGFEGKGKCKGKGKGKGKGTDPPSAGTRTKKAEERLTCTSALCYTQPCTAHSAGLNH